MLGGSLIESAEEWSLPSSEVYSKVACDPSSGNDPRSVLDPGKPELDSEPLTEPASQPLKGGGSNHHCRLTQNIQSRLGPQKISAEFFLIPGDF